MGSDIPGKVIGLGLAFVLCVLMPFITVSVEQEMLERRLVVSDVSDFIDSVVDSRKVIDSELESLNLALASYGMRVSYDIKRYRATVNPDPVHTDDFSVTYVLADDTTNYDQGDKISVHVYAIGTSTSINISRRIAGVFIKDCDVTLTARVR